MVDFADGLSKLPSWSTV